MTKGYQADWNLISCLYMGWDTEMVFGAPVFK